jgi:hypothetical protein
MSQFIIAVRVSPLMQAAVAAVAAYRRFDYGTRSRDTGHTRNRDTGHAHNRDTGHTRSRDTGHTRNRDTGHAHNRDTGHTRNRDTGHTRNRDTGHAHNRDTGHRRNRDTGHAHNRDTGHAHNRDTSHTRSRVSSVWSRTCPPRTCLASPRVPLSRPKRLPKGLRGRLFPSRAILRKVCETGRERYLSQSQLSGLLSHSRP